MLVARCLWAKLKVPRPLSLLVENRMTSKCSISLVSYLTVVFIGLPTHGQETARGVWSHERASAWQEKTGWLVGCNYIPRTAINQLEMWQADTFDPKTIRQELTWASGLGLNSMRVFLHHLLWEQDPQEFVDRIDQYLGIADDCGIKTVFVLFDDVWDPDPQLGKQKAPIPFRHNSRWVQSPAAVLDVNGLLAGIEVFPRSVVLKHGVEDDEKLSHAGSDDYLRLFALGGKSVAKSADHWVVAPCRKCRHVQHMTHGGPATLDAATATVASAVVIKGCHADQGGNRLAIEPA